MGKLVQVKRLFFDRQAVTDAIDKTTRRLFSRFGAFVRRTARQSIRTGGKSNKVSLPGQPPRSHTGLLKRNIFFSYEPAERNVVIGPVALNAVKAGDPVPQVLEHGGASINRKGRRIIIEPRPYMQPAFEKELESLPPMWRDSIK